MYAILMQAIVQGLDRKEQVLESNFFYHWEDNLDGFY